MVCEVCSVDRRENGEIVILDYPRYLAAETPCPNCGSGAERAKVPMLTNLSRLAIERRNARSAVPVQFALGD